MRLFFSLFTLTTFLFFFSGCGSDNNSDSGSSTSSAISDSSSSSVQSSTSSSMLSSASSSSTSAASALIEQLTVFAEREHGYHNFETMVIDSDTAHDTFVTSLLPQSSWGDKETFMSAMNTLQIDYTKENLLLYRHTEGSGSIVVTPQLPYMDGANVTIVIDRDVPGVGTADMAYYLYAYRVSKMVPQVVFSVDEQRIPVTNSAPIACTEEYAPVCGEKEVVCVTAPCDPIPITYSNLCHMQRESFVTYLYNGECDANKNERSVTDPAAIVRSTEQFGHAIMQAYLDPSTNLFLSPFSIISALSMTYGGTYGKSAEEFEALFHYDKNLSVHNSFAALLPQMVPVHNTFTVANSLWPLKEYPFYPAFMSTISKKYGSSVFPTDYPNDPTANETINAWVEKKTKDKIKDLIPGPLSRDTAMVLVNAVYFKGLWSVEFDANDTKNESFSRSDGSRVTTETMHLLADFNYTENSLYQAIDLAYAKQEFSMIIFLPKVGHTLSDIVDHLTTRSIKSVIGEMAPAYVDLALPKFKIKWGTEELKPVLVDLGLESPFSANADFRLMANVPVGAIFISKVLHQTFVELNESGTEAAAATAVSTDLASEGPIPLVFHAERPFIFYIRDNRTGMLLFSGVLADPTSE